MEWIMFLRPMFTVTRVSLILQYHCYYSMRNWWHISTFTSYLQNAINSILDTLPQGDRIHTPDLNNITGLLDSMDDDAVSESDAATEAAVNSIPQFWAKNFWISSDFSNAVILLSLPKFPFSKFIQSTFSSILLAQKFKQKFYLILMLF